MSSGGDKKTAYAKRHAPGGTVGKGLVNQAESFDEIEAMKVEKTIGSTLAALDRYLSTVIGSPAARAAMDALKFENAKVRVA